MMILQEFEAYLEKYEDFWGSRYGRSRKKRTIEIYRDETKMYLEWLNETKGITFTKLEREDVKEYIDYLFKVKGQISSLVNTSVYSLFIFNRFLISNGHQEKIVIYNDDMLEYENEVLYGRISKESFDLFMQSMLENDSSEDKRNYVISILIACGGLRMDEVLNLRMQDVDLEAKEITVSHYSLLRTRKVKISEEVKNILEPYVNKRKERNIETDILFISKRNNRLDRTVYYKAIMEHGRKQGITVSVHHLRSVYNESIYNMLKSGKTIEEIKHMEGHEFPFKLYKRMQSINRALKNKRNKE